MGLCFYNIVFVFLYERRYPEQIKLENVIAEVISLKEEKENSNKYIIKIIENTKIKYSKNTKLIIYTNMNLLPGDIIKINGDFEKANNARNYGGFNYRKYLKIQKIYGIVYVENLNIIDRKSDFISGILKIRLSFINKIDNLYSSKYNEFLNSILLGKMDNIDEEIEKNFKDANILHILAISGSHVTYVIIGIKFILEKICESRRKINIIIIIFLILFMFLTGFTASCIRSCIMSIIFLVSKNLYRKSNFFITIFYSFFILLLINPFYVYSIGMWLSYAGTIGIALFYRFLYRVLELKLKKIPDFCFKIILPPILITISAQILVYPLMIYYFNILSINFLISNFLISYLIGPIVILGYLTIILSFFKINILIHIEEILIYAILNIAKFCADLPYSNIYVITPNIFLIFIYYFFIFRNVYKFTKNKIGFCRALFNFRAFIKKIIKFEKYLYKNLIFILLIIFCISFIMPNTKKLQIFFLDVGQGDCTIIKTPKGKNIIIDGGEGNSGKYDYGENVVLPYVLDRKISKIDYMIISHCDSDHIGGLFSILENLKVEKILIGIQAEKSEQFENLINIVNKKKIDIVFLKANDKIEIEEDLVIDVLWPDKNKIINENILNNNSLVFKLKYKQNSMLFTGDIEEIAEKAILDTYANLKSDIIKISHHGSRTSTTEVFLNRVMPKIALIGVGNNNNFGHPSTEIINRLQNNNIKIYRTDEMGEIHLVINKEKIKINTFINE